MIWPIHPPPFNGQLLYSWTVVLAQEYHVSFAYFCKKVLALTEEALIDDTKLSEEALMILFEGTGVSVHRLRKIGHCE